MICISVRLSDRFLQKEEQNKIIKHCPQLGLNPTPFDHHANALPTKPSQHSFASLDLYALLILEMTKVQNVKWCLKQSSIQKSSGQHIPGQHSQ